MLKTSRFRPNPTWCILHRSLKTIWGNFQYIYEYEPYSTICQLPYSHFSSSFLQSLCVTLASLFCVTIFSYDLLSLVYINSSILVTVRMEIVNDCANDKLNLISMSTIQWLSWSRSYWRSNVHFSGTSKQLIRVMQWTKIYKSWHTWSSIPLPQLRF